jgi:hypothetical protein
MAMHSAVVQVMSLLVQRTRTSDNPVVYPEITVVLDEMFDEVANMYKLVRVTTDSIQHTTYNVCLAECSIQHTYGIQPAVPFAAWRTVRERACVRVSAIVCAMHAHA